MAFLKMSSRWMAVPALLSLAAIQGFGQIKADQIDHWISIWPYANPSYLDSLPFWANKLESASREINYPRGLLYATRIRGYHHDFNGDLEEATKHYLLFLEKARKFQLIDDEILCHL